MGRSADARENTGQTRKRKKINDPRNPTVFYRKPNRNLTKAKAKLRKRMMLTHHLRSEARMDRSNEGHGLRSIGGLVPKITNGLRPNGASAGSAPTASPTNSLTSGSNSPAPRAARSAGGGLGETASGRSLSVAVQANDPEALDRAIVASLPRSVASVLRPIERTWNDPVYGFDFEIVGYRLDGDPPAADVMQARQMVGQHLRPAAQKVIAQEIARLRVSTKSREESETDLAMRFQVLAEECAEYPPDVVVSALRGWAKAEVFFPSLSEIRDRLQRAARRRRKLLEALS